MRALSWARPYRSIQLSLSWRLRDKRVICRARPSLFAAVSNPATHSSMLPARPTADELTAFLSRSTTPATTEDPR